MTASQLFMDEGNIFSAVYGWLYGWHWYTLYVTSKT